MTIESVKGVVQKERIVRELHITTVTRSPEVTSSPKEQKHRRVKFEKNISRKLLHTTPLLRMNPWVIAPYSVTPVASLLTRCVASGVLSQEDVDSVPREPRVFSPHLLEAEQLITMERELDKINLEMELLKLEKESADVTHKFYLTKRFTSLQQFTSHLQDVLREQASLRRRLMKPLCQTNLPVEADLHRYVVEVMRMVVDFIENLEAKISTVRTIPTIEDSMSNLNNGIAQLLAQVTEVERLSKQVLQWRSHNSSTSINDITT